MAPSNGVIGAVLSVMLGDPVASTCAGDYTPASIVGADLKVGPYSSSFLKVGPYSSSFE
jgi:hypothetical protein